VKFSEIQRLSTSNKNITIKILIIIFIQYVKYRHTDTGPSEELPNVYTKQLYQSQQEIELQEAQLSLWVPRRLPHRRSGLATLPSVGAVPQSPHIIVD